MGEYRKKYEEDFKKNVTQFLYAGTKLVKEMPDCLVFATIC